VGLTYQQECKLRYPWDSFVTYFKGKPIVNFSFFAKLIGCTMISDHI